MYIKYYYNIKFSKITFFFKISSVSAIISYILFFLDIKLIEYLSLFLLISYHHHKEKQYDHQKTKIILEILFKYKR